MFCETDRFVSATKRKKGENEGMTDLSLTESRAVDTSDTTVRKRSSVDPNEDGKFRSRLSAGRSEDAV